METFKVLEEKLDAALNGTTTSLDFYQAVFGRIVLLSAKERGILVEKASGLGDTSTFGTAAFTLLLGMSDVFDARFQSALGILKEADDYFSSINEQGGVMASNNLLSIAYRSMGQLDAAQAHIQKALKASEAVDTKSLFRYFKTVTYYQAGELHTMSKNYDLAREYYNKGMEFVGENPELEGRLLNGLGNMMMQTDDWEKALDNFNLSLVTAKKAENPLLESKIYADIGNYYLRKKDYPLALENQYKSLEIRTERGFINPSITNYINLSEIYLELNDTAQAIKFGTLAVETATKLNVLIKLYEAHAILSKAYEKSGHPAKAYEHFKQFHKYREEVHNQEAIKKIEQLQSSHKMEIMEQEKEIFRLKNVELRVLLEEIGDSFRYARRIQTSLLPTERYIERTLERLRRK
jgi:tetratricopeptide (TPR) repeat protein